VKEVLEDERLVGLREFRGRLETQLKIPIVRTIGRKGLERTSIDGTG